LKPLLKLFIFFFLLSFFSCSITKRRYIGGYYVSWRKKAPQTHVINLESKAHYFPNKIVEANNSTLKTAVTEQIESANFQNAIQTVNHASQTKQVSKNSSINLFTNPVLSSYTITPENTVPGHNQLENDSSKKDVRISWLLCLLGFLSGLILGFIALGLDFHSTYNDFDAGLILIIPLVLLTISLVHSFMGIIKEHKWGLLAIVLLDLLFGAILVTAILILWFLS
jgi:hypothetical protein